MASAGRLECSVIPPPSHVKNSLRIVRTPSTLSTYDSRGFMAARSIIGTIISKPHTMAKGVTHRKEKKKPKKAKK